MISLMGNMGKPFGLYEFRYGFGSLLIFNCRSVCTDLAIWGNSLWLGWIKIACHLGCKPNFKNRHDCAICIHLSSRIRLSWCIGVSCRRMAICFGPSSCNNLLACLYTVMCYSLKILYMCLQIAFLFVSSLLTSSVSRQFCRSGIGRWLVFLPIREGEHLSHNFHVRI